MCVTVLVLFGLMLVGLSSCIPERKIKVEAFVWCTTDLLEFVTPVLTIEANGTTETFILTDTDFKPSTQINVDALFGGRSSTSCTTIVAIKEKIYDDVASCKGVMRIKYELKPTHNPDKEVYYFRQIIGYNSWLIIDDVTKQGPSNIITDLMDKVKKEDIEKYIAELTSSELVSPLYVN